MAVYYVKSGAGAAEFAQSTAYSSGNKIVPKRSDTGTNHLLAKRYVWECTTGGTSAAAEPTWPAAVTADTTTVTSNTAIFTARKPGFSSGTTANWAFATIYMDYVGALAASGDTVYVSNNHAESVATPWGQTNTTALQGGVSYLCVDDSATPPTALATTATVTTTGANNIAIGSATAIGSYVYGVTFICGVGSSSNLNIGFACSYIEQCGLQLASTGSNTVITNSGASTLKNCTFKFANAAQNVGLGGNTVIQSCSIDNSGTTPTSIFFGAGTIFNCDFSNLASTINLSASGSTANAYLRFYNCKLPASWSGSLDSTVSGLRFANFTEMVATGNAGNVYEYQNKTNGGSVIQETTIVRTGGATNGTTAYSYRLVTTSAAQYPFIRAYTGDIVKWNATTGSSITVTAEVIHDSVTNLTDKECWLEVSYYGASGSQLGSYVSNAPNFMASASNLAASSAAWTTTGMTNPNKQKLSVSFTPQLKGFIIARVFLAKTSKTVYVCPKIDVS